MTDIAKWTGAVPDEVAGMLEAYNPGHDDYQIKHFVVGPQATPYGKWRQAVAETYGYWSAATQAALADRRLRAEIAVLEAERDALKTFGRHWTKARAAKALLKEAEIEEKRHGLLLNMKAFDRAVNELGKFSALASEHAGQVDWSIGHETLSAIFHAERLAAAMAHRELFGEQHAIGDLVMAMPAKDKMRVIDAFESARVHAIQNFNRLKAVAEAPQPTSAEASDRQSIAPDQLNRSIR